MTERRMTHQEAVALCRLAKAACPQQQFDEWTPDMWAEILGDLTFGDCKAGLMTVVSSKPFCSPAEVRDAVKVIRDRRLSEFGELPPPPRDLPDDPRAYAEWKGEMIRRIADGEGAVVASEYAAVEAGFNDHPLPELGHVTRRVPVKA